MHKILLKVEQDEIIPLPLKDALSLTCASSKRPSGEPSEGGIAAAPPLSLPSPGAVCRKENEGRDRNQVRHHCKFAFLLLSIQYE
jgi:hypothetical protein